MTPYLIPLILLLSVLNASHAAIQSVNEQDKPASDDSLLPSLMQASRINLMRMEQQGQSQEQQPSTPAQFDYYDAVRDEDNRRRQQQQQQQFRRGQFIPRAMVLESEPNFANVVPNGRVFRFLQPVNSRNPQQPQLLPEVFVVEGDTYDDTNEKVQPSRPELPAIVRPVSTPLLETTSTMSPTFEVSGEVQAEDNKQATSQKFESRISESATSSPETALPTEELLADDDAKTDETVLVPDPTPSSIGEDSTGSPATALETDPSESAPLAADEKTDGTVTDPTPSSLAEDATDSSTTALETATLAADIKTDESANDATPSPDSAKDSTDSATTADVAESTSSTEEPMPELVAAPRFNRA